MIFTKVFACFTLDFVLGTASIELPPAVDVTLGPCTDLGLARCIEDANSLMQAELVQPQRHKTIRPIIQPITHRHPAIQPAIQHTTEEMESKYWKLVKTQTYPLTYSVAPCPEEEYEQATEGNTGDRIYGINGEQGKQHTAEGAKTFQKLRDPENYNKIIFDPTKFGRQTDPPNDHWIFFHKCIYNDGQRDAQILVKIGASNKLGYCETLADEVYQAVAKSYHWCDAGTIQIYVYPGGSNREENQYLKECLRYHFRPASEEEDQNDDYCQFIASKNINNFCTGGCASLPAQAFAPSNPSVPQGVPVVQHDSPMQMPLPRGLPIPWGIFMR